MSSLSETFPKIGNISKGSRVVVLTGAGVSAESGIKTFRDSGGLWEEHDIQEVATPEAWERNPELVQRFYNERRRQLLKCKPNEAHLFLAKLQEKFQVDIVTQNVDDLHERASSESVMHLHGELRKARSSKDERLVYDIEGWELRMGEYCELGSQLRPHVVWFGEMVPMILPASELVSQADLVMVIGTSLAVYPAAGLINEVSPGVPVVVIDPGEVDVAGASQVVHIKKRATQGVKDLVTKMLGL